MSFNINKKLFFKIYIPFTIIVILFLVILQVLGSKSRIGYLSDFKLLDDSNSQSNNYIYNFRIRYYDKIFRNSDIYAVYPDLSSLPDFVKEVKMDYDGSPFGILISDKLITEEKIDNVNYILKVKSDLISIISSILLILLIILIIIYYNEIVNLYKQFQFLYNYRLKEYKIIQFLNNNAKNLFIILYAYISFPIINNILINSGLDNSWVYFINKVVHTNFKFGKDIIFTYGHLGYLINPLNIENNILFSFIFKFIIYVINVISVYLLIKQEYDFNIFKIFLIIPSLIYFNAYIMYDLFDYYISFTLILLLYLDIKIDKIILYIIFCLLVSVAFFIKMGTAILNIATVFIYLGFSLFFINKKFFIKRIIISISIPILVFIIYYIYNPNIKYLFLFIKGSLEISSGYIYAMSFTPNNYIWVVFGYIFALIYSVLFIYYYIKKNNNFYIMLIISPLFYIAYKHAFVRHTWIFIYSFSFIIFILLLNLINRKTKLKDFLIMSFIIIFILYRINPIKICNFIIFNKAKDISKTLNIVFNYKSMDSYGDILTQLPKEMLNEIGNDTVTIYPWKISYIAKNNINFIPMPIFQAYSAYTPYLDNLNASFFDNDNSPKYIVFEWQSIDGRLPLTDTPKTFRNIYNNYYIYDIYDGKYILLKQRDNKLDNSTVLSNFTKNINIKNMVILKANMKLNFIGKIAKLIYQIPEVTANIETENGNKYGFRILLEQLNNGMIINRIPTNLIEFERFFDDYIQTDKVKSINFSGKGLWLYKSNIDFVFDIYYKEIVINF